MAKLPHAFGALRTPVVTTDLDERRDALGDQVDDAALHLEVPLHVEQRMAPHDPTQPRYPWSQLMVEQATADDVLQQAIDKLRGRQSISVSGLQRLMGVGYPRAARLMDELEAAGIVGPEEDRRSGRPVLLDEEDLPD
jgi:DNA segregation ATPase FtsK/SpoIIIE-like protein